MNVLSLSLKKNEREAPHLLSCAGLSKREIEGIMARAAEFETRIPHPTGDRKICALLFFQASTRTKMGFQTAASLLGHGWIDPGDTATMRTSMTNGESLADCVASVSRYADALVIRTPSRIRESGILEQVDCPIINGGDSDHEHPTQGMIDLYAMRRDIGSLKGAWVACAGDPSARHLQSLLHLLAKEGLARFTICAKDAATAKARLGDAADALAASGCVVDVTADIDDIMDADIITAHPQDIRSAITSSLGGPKAVIDESDARYHLTAERIERTGSTALIYHPLPRTAEICRSVDSTPNARYLAQVKRSTPVRMAILERVLAGGAWTI